MKTFEELEVGDVIYGLSQDFMYSTYKIEEYKITYKEPRHIGGVKFFLDHSEGPLQSEIVNGFLPIAKITMDKYFLNSPSCGFMISTSKEELKKWIPILVKREIELLQEREKELERIIKPFLDYENICKS